MPAFSAEAVRLTKARRTAFGRAGNAVGHLPSQPGKDRLNLTLRFRISRWRALGEDLEPVADHLYGVPGDEDRTAIREDQLRLGNDVPVVGKAVDQLQVVLGLHGLLEQTHVVPLGEC